MLAIAGRPKIYASNISRAREKLNWEPKIDIREVLEKLEVWVKENKAIL